LADETGAPGSYAFFRRLGHLPGTPLAVFLQQNSSTNRHPHFRRSAITRSFTYRLALTVFRMVFDIQEKRAVGREDRRNVVRAD
jgi:hypothetical protein